MKKCVIFLIFAQNIDRVYTLTPVFYIKVGYNGVYITQTRKHDGIASKAVTGNGN